MDDRHDKAGGRDDPCRPGIDALCVECRDAPWVGARWPTSKGPTYANLCRPHAMAWQAKWGGTAAGQGLSVRQPYSARELDALRGDATSASQRPAPAA